MKVTLNQDKEMVNEIRTAIKANDGYCPCSLIKTADTKCMCKDFRDMVASNTEGECNCGLYNITTDETIQI